MSRSDSDGWRFRRDGPSNVEQYLGASSPLKFYVLDLVEKRGSISYDELAAESGMPDEYAANYLVEYSREGVLRRQRMGDNGLSVFQLTEKGQSRLRYFRSQTTAT